MRRMRGSYPEGRKLIDRLGKFIGAEKKFFISEMVEEKRSKGRKLLDWLVGKILYMRSFLRMRIRIQEQGN
jgi:hypothetical protein